MFPVICKEIFNWDPKSSATNRLTPLKLRTKCSNEIELWVNNAPKVSTAEENQKVQNVQKCKQSNR